MEKIRIQNLREGSVYPQTIFSLTGQKLLGAGVALTGRHLSAMRQFGEIEVVLADSINELAEAGLINRVDSSKLAVGQKSHDNLITRAGQVLVESGEEIEAHHIDAIKAGGETYAAKAEAKRQQKQQAQRRERILMADALVEDLEQQVPGMSLRVTALETCNWIKPADPSHWPTPQNLADWRAMAVEQLRQLYARIEAGLPLKMEQFKPIIDDLLDKLSHHPTRFTQLALLCPRREDYLPDHAYTVTVLAMAIAAQLRWPLEAVRRIGEVGFVFDLGMLLVPERIRTGGCELTDIDRSRVQRHPVFSLAMIQVIENADPIVQLAALQHQERENGSGYPRGTRKDALCDYARVLAVADSFAATTEPRHYRKPKLPYIAMEETIRSTSANSLWKPAVRALLQAAGLFPVGSYVKLSSGVNAHVIATNPVLLDRPTVQLLSAEGTPTTNIIDLAEVPKQELTVARPLSGPKG
ncbi:MAG: hypothetical protein K8S99_06475 [Planctomycetes bacterium]|nr:hypothetical protein [Planctomycetota bacterium]